VHCNRNPRREVKSCHKGLYVARKKQKQKKTGKANAIGGSFVAPKNPARRRRNPEGATRRILVSSISGRWRDDLLSCRILGRCRDDFLFWRFWVREDTIFYFDDSGSVTRITLRWRFLVGGETIFYFDDSGSMTRITLLWRFLVGGETIFYFDDSGSMTRLSYSLARLKRWRFFNFFKNITVLLFLFDFSAPRLFIWANFTGYE